MEGRAKVELNTGKLEEIAPHVSGEHRVLVTNDGVGKAMQAKDGFKEHLGDRGGGVGVAQRDEVSMLGGAIHHY